MSVEKKVPEIRFKGFSGEWLERRFSDIATRVSTQHQSTYLPCVEYEDIVAGKGRFNKDIHQKKTFKAGLKFEVNDVLFGKLRPYLKNWLLADFEGIAVGDFWVLRADNVASMFLFSLIQTNKFELISNLSAGSKMPRSDWGLVSSSCFFVPNNIPESDKIGNTFQKLDSLINQHQEKHDKLSSIKKAMLEKMFPKQDETTPEIRFKGFSGEWEEKALGVLADYANGKGHEDKQKASGKYELINLNSIAIGGGLKPSGKFIDETNSTLEENDLVMVLSDVGHGDLLGRVALIPKSNTYVLNQRVALLRPNEAISPLFLLYNINAHQSYFKKQGAGMSQLNISRGSVESFPSCVPEKKEQTKIGNYFQKIDTLINQHQQQITKLNNIKQACLSKMFA